MPRTGDWIFPWILVVVFSLNVEGHEFETLPKIDAAADLDAFLDVILPRFSLSPVPWMTRRPVSAAKCVDGQHIYEILRLDAGAGLHHYSDNDTLQQTCVVLLHHLLHLPESCVAGNAAALKARRYASFFDEVFGFDRTNEPEGKFSRRQLASIVERLETHWIAEGKRGDDHDHDHDENAPDHHEDPISPSSSAANASEPRCAGVHSIWESEKAAVGPLEASHLLTKLIIELWLGADPRCDHYDKHEDENHDEEDDHERFERPTSFVDELIEEFGVDGEDFSAGALDKIFRSLKAGKEEKGVEPEKDGHDDKHLGHVHRRRRAVNDDDDNHEHHDERPRNESCFNLETLMRMHQINGRSVSMAEFYSLCPALVQQSISNSCVSIHLPPDPTPTPNRTLPAPVTTTEAYGFGFLAVTIITLTAFAGILTVPCLERRFYDAAISALLCLGVGTMVGDALLHLVPFCLGLHSHDHENHEDGSDEDRSPVWKMFCVFLAIYVFYLLETFFSYLTNVWKPARQGSCGGGVRDNNADHGHDRIHHYVPEQFSASREKRSAGIETPPQPMNLASHFSLHDGVSTFKGRKSGESPPRPTASAAVAAITAAAQAPANHAAAAAAAVANASASANGSANHVDLSDESVDPNSFELCVDRLQNHVTTPYGHVVSGSADASPTDVWHLKPTTSATSLQMSSRTASSVEGIDVVGAALSKPPALACGIPSVSLLVLVGDGIHNFADGVAIGAAFTASLRVGVTTSVAVLLHELPHEFGDFAIFVTSGIGVKKALGLNLLSALSAYLGLFIGLSVASEEWIRVWIMAITAGMFLYISLVDMLPEIMHNKESRTLLGFGLQNLGIWIGVILMLLMALYEDLLSH